MKARLALLTWLFSAFCGAEAYYYEDFKTRNASSNTPYPYSSAICEDQQGFESARNADFGWFWMKISLAEFCRLVHQHRDNSCDYKKSKSFGDVIRTTEHCHERDRLTAGCRSSRWMQDKFYRCRNIQGDLNAERARADAERKRIYEEWKKQVEEKKRNLLIETEPYRKELQRQLAENQKLEAERKAAYEKMEAEAAQAKTKIEAFEVFQDKFLEELNASFEAYDTQAAQLQNSMKADAEETEKNINLVKAAIDETLSREVTVVRLNQLDQENADRLSHAVVCAEPRSLSALMKMRRLVGKMNTLAAVYETRVKNLVLPSRFAEYQRIVSTNLSELSTAIAKRGDVFGKDAEVLEKRPEVCGIMAQLPALIGARRSQAAVGETTMAIGALASDFSDRMNRSIQRLTAEKQATEANRYLVSLEGTFQSQVNQGRLNDALATEAGATSALAFMLDNLKESGLAEDRLSELNHKAKELKDRLRADKEALLSLSGMRGRLQVRLQALVVKRHSVSQQADEIERARWQETERAIAAEVLQACTTGVVPQFSSQEQALAFDGTLAGAELKIQTFVNEAKAQGGN